jgi:small subunit ribosomal protein S20
MANIVSAKKRARQTVVRAARNQMRVSRIRGFIRKVEQAIATGSKEEAQTAFKLAQPEIHRGVSKGVLHKNTAARKLSRLSGRIKVLAS